MSLVQHDESGEAHQGWPVLFLPSAVSARDKESSGPGVQVSTNKLDTIYQGMDKHQVGRHTDRVPSVIRSCGHDVTVAFPERLPDFEDKKKMIAGCVCQYANVILISGEGQYGIPLSGATQEETFLHEYIHYLENKMGFELKENDVIRLATGLYQLLADNDIYFYRKGGK